MINNHTIRAMGHLSSSFFFSFLLLVGLWGVISLTDSYVEVFNPVAL